MALNTFFIVIFKNKNPALFSIGFLKLVSTIYQVAQNSLSLLFLLGSLNF